MSKAIWLLILLSLSVPANPALAQHSTSTVSGSITSEDGRPLAEVRIEWDQAGQTVSLLSSAGGEFGIVFAAPGGHVLTFSHPSAGAAGRHEMILSPGTTLRLQVVLYDHWTDPGGNPWEIKSTGEIQDSWQPERVLTDAQLNGLPGTGHIWSLLNHTEVSVVAERFDISGLHSHRPFLIGVRGSSWTQNQATVNGVSVSHPSGEGMLVFPDIAAMETIVYSIGDSATLHSGAGAHLDFIPKAGTRELHGGTQLHLQSGALQTANVSSRNLSFGITEPDERWNRFVDSGLQMGGPVGSWPWTWYGAGSGRNIDKNIRNHAAPVTATVLQESLNITGVLSPKDRLSIYGSAQQLNEPQADASPQIPRESSLNQRSRYRGIQSAWTKSLSARTVMDFRGGAAFGGVREEIQPGALGQSSENLFPGYAVAGFPDSPSPLAMVKMLSNTRTGPAPLAASSSAANVQGSGLLSLLRSWPAGFHQYLQMGADIQARSMSINDDAINGINLLFFQGVPSAVRVLNTPAGTHDRIRQWEVTANDSISLARFTLTAGATLHKTTGYNRLKSGTTANIRSWSSASGRIGIARQIWHSHGLLVRAGLARIASQPITSTWAAVNPDGMGADLYSWDDLNGDRQYQTGKPVRS